MLMVIIKIEALDLPTSATMIKCEIICPRRSIVKTDRSRQIYTSLKHMCLSLCKSVAAWLALLVIII